MQQLVGDQHETKNPFIPSGEGGRSKTRQIVFLVMSYLWNSLLQGLNELRGNRTSSQERNFLQDVKSVELTAGSGGPQEHFRDLLCSCPALLLSPR